MKQLYLIATFFLCLNQAFAQWTSFWIELVIEFIFRQKQLVFCLLGSTKSGKLEFEQNAV